MRYCSDISLQSKVTVINATTLRPSPAVRIHYTRDQLLALNPHNSLPHLGVAYELGLILVSLWTQLLFHVYVLVIYQCQFHRFYQSMA